MKIWGCVKCRTGYHLRIFTCPRCHGTDFEEKDLMPKITVAGVSGVEDETPQAPVEEVPETTPEPPATPSEEDTLPEVVVPSKSASKAKWVEFATAQGAEDADQYTRDELALWWESTNSHNTKLEITAEAEVS